MEEQILGLADLSNAELTAIRADIDKSGAKSMYSIDEKDGKVTIKDPVEAVHDEDPRTGVMADAPPIPDAVRRRLEGPFDSTEEPKSKEPVAVTPSDVADADELFEPDPADVRNFIRATIGNVRYAKEFVAYGGAVRFTLSARTSKEDEDCVYHAEGLSNFRFLIELAKQRLAYSLTSLRIGKETITLTPVTPGRTVTFAPSDTDDLVTAAQEASAEIPLLQSEERVSRLQCLPQHVMSILNAEMSGFDMLLLALQQRANDPKFWETDTAD